MIIVGDCLEVMKTLDAGSIDAIVTDPPYGISFMGKNWDSGVPGVAFWREALRVAKPGCHILAAGGSRTFHRLAVAIEDAGWEIRDCVLWLYGSGFPKSHDVSKAIDKAAGAEREVVGVSQHSANRTAGSWQQGEQRTGIAFGNEGERSITAPATEAAKQWDGWGTALKPAFEPFILARKPLDGTVADNVLTHGTGGINVDGCRVSSNGDKLNVGGVGSKADGWDRPWKHDSEAIAECKRRSHEAVAKAESLGRWPANVIHDGSDEVTQLFGTAARFFYVPKASRSEREAGLDGMDSIYRANGNKWTDEDYRVKTGERPPSAESGPQTNHHPTVKPVALMSYLCRLITPPNGTILDPFCGSGSTGVAAIREGFKFVGIELNPDYAEIATRRIDHERQRTSLFEAIR